MLSKSPVRPNVAPWAAASTAFNRPIGGARWPGVVRLPWSCSALVPLAFIGLAATPLIYADRLPDGAIGYDAIEVVDLFGGGSVTPVALDNFARVVFDSGQAPAVPAVWINGRSFALDYPPGSLVAFVEGISPSRGLIVGRASPPPEYWPRAIGWVRGELLELGDVPWSRYDYADAVNDHGWVVGHANFPTAPILWRPGEEGVNLGGIPGGNGWGQATAINNLNEVTGYSGDVLGGYRPFLWVDGQGMRSIGEADPRLGTGSGYGINDAREIVGEFYSRHDVFGWRTEAFHWREDVVTLLPHFIPQGCSFPHQARARAINNRGEIVGRGASADCTLYVPSVWWESAPGVYSVADLNDRTNVRGLPAWNLLEAYDINNGGQIIAHGGLLMTPYHYALGDLIPGRAGEQNTITISNLPPGSGDVYLMHGLHPGAQTINAILGTGGGGNPPIDCPGAPILIQQPRGVFGPFTADLNGEITLEFMIPTPASGQTVRMQVAVPDECRVSHVVEVTIE